MVNTPCSEVAWRALITHSILQFPLHFPSHASPCVITFQLESTNISLEHNTSILRDVKNQAGNILWEWPTICRYCKGVRRAQSGQWKLCATERKNNSVQEGGKNVIPQLKMQFFGTADIRLPGYEMVWQCTRPENSSSQSRDPQLWKVKFLLLSQF